MSEIKEWCVDWEVDVRVTMTKTVTHSTGVVIEAETAEEAVEKAKDEMFVEANDLDLQLDPDDLDLDEPDMDTFKVIGRVTPFNH